MSAAAPLLLADIGGTRARFALAREGRVGPIHEESVADHATPLAAIRAFLEVAAPDPGPRRAALALAGPIRGAGDAARGALTNAHWTLEAAALRDALAFDRVLLVNDFAAVAHAIPSLEPDDWVAVGGGDPVPGGAIAVLGPGTGLGVAGLLVHGERVEAIVGEGGHVTLPACDPEEAALLERLRGRFGHVSAERVLCGEGLVTLRQALAEQTGRAAEALTPPEITARALSGEDPDCVETLSRFCAFLGTVAGDLALTLGARGGVYLAGGILPRLTGFFAASGFRARFEAKGRFGDYLAAIPTRVVTRSHPAFAGLVSLDRQD